MFNMTLQEALTILTTFHAWRIGDDEVHMQKPSEVTKAIETLLNYHIVEANKMVDKNLSNKWKEYQDWLNEVPELSDEEIEKGAKEWYEIEGAYKPSMIAIKTWLNACKWYREQLKNK